MMAGCRVPVIITTLITKHFWRLEQTAGHKRLNACLTLTVSLIFRQILSCFPGQFGRTTPTMIIHWQRHAVCLRSTLYGAVCCLPASALQVLGRTAWAFACVARFCAITAILIKTALCLLHRACSDARDAPFGPPAGAIRQIKVPANRQHTARCGTQRQAGTLQPRLEAASSDLLPFKCR